MPWWVILVLVLTVCMCLGPVMLMQPSAGQRKLARLRASALNHGLKVRSGSIKTTEGTKQLCVYFRSWPNELISRVQLLEPWCLVRNNFEHPMHFYKAWAFDELKHKSGLVGDSAIYQALDELPPSIFAIECFVGGLGLYWSEQGDEETLTFMSKWLDGFSENVKKKCL